ncbi:MAG: hypothetical protein SV062_00820, partial [Thermodesulfobacteriota bacterium]|nr:hypothetical protein [Thermodesulfobacteriota bacterium]
MADYKWEYPHCEPLWVPRLDQKGKCAPFMDHPEQLEDLSLPALQPPFWIALFIAEKGLSLNGIKKCMNEHGYMF